MVSIICPLQGNNLPMTVLPVPFPAQSYARPLYSSDELPKNVVINLNQGYAVKSLDFHPVQPTLLLGLPFLLIGSVLLFIYLVIFLKWINFSLYCFPFQLEQILVKSPFGRLLARRGLFLGISRFGTLGNARRL